MAELGYLRAFMDAIGLVGLKTANRFGQALTDAEATGYTYEKAASDTLGFYDDVLSALFGLSTGSIPIPVDSVTMKITQGSPTASATLPLALAAGALDKTALHKIGLPATPKIPSSKVTLTVNPPNLTITINDLGMVTEGIYKGLISVHATGAPVLEVYLRVVP